MSQELRDQIEKLAAGDAAAMDAFLADDFVQEWPQSGEMVRGKAACSTVMKNYPGGMPQVNVGRISGEGDHWTVESTTTYPDGETYHVVSILERRDGRFIRQVDYFGPEFPAPEWRQQWVEPIQP